MDKKNPDKICDSRTATELETTVNCGGGWVCDYFSTTDFACGQGYLLDMAVFPFHVIEKLWNSIRDQQDLDCRTLHPPNTGTVPVLEYPH